MTRKQGTELQPQAAPSPPSTLDAAADRLRSVIDQARTVFAEHSGPIAQKAGAAARAAIRTGKEVRRVIRSGAGEIGQEAAGQTGREVASYAVTVGLGWLSCLLPIDDEDIPLDDDHTGGA